MNDAEMKMFEQARKLKGATPEIEATFPDKPVEVPKNAHSVPLVESLPPIPMPLVESPFVVFTEVEKDGWVWHPTFREGMTPAKIKSAILLMQTAQAELKANGFTFHERKSGFPKYEKKAVEYVDGVCPVDGGKLIKGTTKTGKGFVSCENRKYDFATKSTVGCEHIVWQ